MVMSATMSRQGAKLLVEPTCPRTNGWGSEYRARDRPSMFRSRTEELHQCIIGGHSSLQGLLVDSLGVSALLLVCRLDVPSRPCAGLLEVALSDARERGFSSRYTIAAFKHHPHSS